MACRSKRDREGSAGSMGCSQGRPNERMQLTWLPGAPSHAGFGSPAWRRAVRPRFNRHAADASRWAARSKRAPVLPELGLGCSNAKNKRHFAIKLTPKAGNPSSHRIVAHLALLTSDASA